MGASEADALLSRLRSARRLPSPPGTALRVVELSRRDDVDVHAIADVIMSDPALSTRLLKYANSSLVGAGREVTSIRDAVLLLGLRTVKITALGFSLAGPEFQPHCFGFSLAEFWANSFATATIARRIAADRFTVDREEAFTVGLLAGIGQLALAYGVPEEYGRVLQCVEAGQSPTEVEQLMLGTDHIEFGAQLLAEWGLPEVLVEAVRCHANPGDPSQFRHRAHTLAYVVHLAKKLAPLFVGPRQVSEEQQAAMRHIIENALKLDEPTWLTVADEIMTDYRQVADLFDLRLSGPTSVFDLYAEAQEEFTRVGMVTQLERARALEENRTLLRRATTDPLTGVANRAKCDQRLAELVASARSGQGHFAVAMIDIDHFKRLNDTYGHEAGDLILKQVADAIFTALREGDLVARYGGEEFVVLAPCADRREACILAARLCKTIGRTRAQFKGKELGVTASLGLAISSDYEAVPEAARIVADADRQLYLSKRAGRNTWSYLGRTASKLPASRATA